jgi:hypothetical protein
MRKICYFIGLIFISCSSGNKHKTALVLKNESSEKSYEQIILEGELLSPNSDIPLGNIVDLVDDHIIISSGFSNNVFSVYQLKGDSLIEQGQFIRRGEGPFEMIQPSSFYDKLENRIYVYDHVGYLKTIYSIDVCNIQNLFETSTWEEVRVPIIKDYFLGSWMRKMNDNSFLILGSKVGSKNLFSEINLTNNSISELTCPYPEQDGVFNVDIVVKQGVYLTGVIEKRPSLNQVVYACESGGYAEIIDFTGFEINRILIMATYPKYITRDGINRSYLDDCLRGMQVRVTEKYIYMLPYPLTKGAVRRKESYKGYPSYCSDELLVFNWNGEFVKKYAFDTPVYSFVVDQNDHFLYAATVKLEDEGEIMKRYRMKSERE